MPLNKMEIIKKNAYISWKLRKLPTICRIRPQKQHREDIKFQRHSLPILVR